MEPCSTNGVFVTVALILAVATQVICSILGTSQEHVGQGGCHSERCIYSKSLQCDETPEVTEYHTDTEGVERQNQLAKDCKDDLKELVMEFIREQAKNDGKKIKQWLDDNIGEKVTYNKDTNTYYLTVHSSTTRGDPREAKIEVRAKFHQPQVVYKKKNEETGEEEVVKVDGKVVYVDDPDRDVFPDNEFDIIYLKKIKSWWNPSGEGYPTYSTEEGREDRERKRKERRELEAAEKAEEAARAAAKARQFHYVMARVVKEQMKSFRNSIVQSPGVRAARESIKSFGNKMKSIFSGSLFRRGRRTSESNYSSDQPGTHVDQPAATDGQPATPAAQPEATASQPETPADQPAATAGQQKTSGRKTVTFQVKR
ncbi:uncharacterized protein LOC129001469 [Macrosteles quadrilineatus]|uniref:uncharacterized protein LOC129001469 n=1 Tax=Macrosteles quadrilineatus TaxID=74068 RepID=UPI0023E0CDD4|nr:uncharacterized protein LOC129001469 [Macrosteles quadrilineatus]